MFSETETFLFSRPQDECQIRFQERPPDTISEHSNKGMNSLQKGQKMRPRLGSNQQPLD